MSVFSEYNAYNFLFFLHTDAALEQDIKYFMKITIMRTLFLFTSAIFSTPLTYLKTLLSEKWNCILWYLLLFYAYYSYLLLTQFWGVEELPGIIIFFLKIFIVTTLLNTVWISSEKKSGWYPSEGEGYQSSALRKMDSGDIITQRLTKSVHCFRGFRISEFPKGEKRNKLDHPAWNQLTPRFHFYY